MDHVGRVVLLQNIYSFGVFSYLFGFSLLHNWCPYFLHTSCKPTIFNSKLFLDSKSVYMARVYLVQHSLRQYRITGKETLNGCHQSLVIHLPKTAEGLYSLCIILTCVRSHFNVPFPVKTFD